MSDKDITIEERIRRVKAIYSKLSEIIDSFAEYLPKGEVTYTALNLIKDKVFGNEDLNKFLSELESRRPPRLFLVGRTGIGKSSLINALCGSYIAPVSHVEACTPTAEPYRVKDGGRVLMEICDSRGIAESESINDEVDAEKMAIDNVNSFKPDIIVLMLSATQRDNIVGDINFIKKMLIAYKKAHKVEPPVITVITKCDDVDPSRVKEPEKYPESKTTYINGVVEYYKGIITENGLRVDNVIAVSSYIEWETPDGRGINSITLSEYDSLQIKFDGRYHIEELKNMMADAILDPSAKMGFYMAARLNQVLHKLADHFTNTFSVIASAVVALPISIADVYLLLVVQAILVTIIAALSGEDLSVPSAIKFLGSMGGTVGAAFFFRTSAHLVLSLVPVPFLCDAISAAIAASGTQAIGKAAAAFYIDGLPTDKVKKIFKKENKHQTVMKS